MAVPLKQNSDTPLKDFANGEVPRESGGRMKFGVAWVWLLVVLFFVALVWFFVHGWGGSKQEMRSGQLHMPTQIVQRAA